MARSASQNAKRLKAKGAARKKAKAAAKPSNRNANAIREAADRASGTSDMLMQASTNNNDVQEDVNDAAVRTEKEIKVVKNRLHLQQKAFEKRQEEEDVVKKPLKSKNNRWGF